MSFEEAGTAAKKAGFKLVPVSAMPAAGTPAPADADASDGAEAPAGEADRFADLEIALDKETDRKRRPGTSPDRLLMR
jgi:hypothetical protein